jgi:hypothetical protein
VLVADPELATATSVVLLVGIVQHEQLLMIMVSPKLSRTAATIEIAAAGEIVAAQGEGVAVRADEKVGLKIADHQSWIRWAA